MRPAYLILAVAGLPILYIAWGQFINGRFQFALNNKGRAAWCYFVGAWGVFLGGIMIVSGVAGCFFGA